MANEVLVKQERNAWAVVLKALATATSNGQNHIHQTSDSLLLKDISALLTKVKRINTSYAKGSTTSSYGVTDLFLSPEMVGDIREFAYNAVGNEGTDLPAGVREEIYRGAGAQEIFGISLHELVELGKNGKYNVLFDSFYGANPGIFNPAADEVLIGLDLSKDAFVRPVARNSETGGTFTAVPDDQFVSRSEKLGFYGSLEEGRVCLDGRAVAGIIVKSS